MKLEFTVNNADELAAALRTAAQPTYEQARKHPVYIQYGTAHYNFRSGVHEKRADELAHNISKTLRKRHNPT